MTAQVKWSTLTRADGVRVRTAKHKGLFAVSLAGKCSCGECENGIHQLFAGMTRTTEPMLTRRDEFHSVEDALQAQKDAKKPIEAFLRKAVTAKEGVFYQ